MSDPTIPALFAPEPGITCLDAATYGLPPASTVDAVEAIRPFLREPGQGWT